MRLVEDEIEDVLPDMDEGETELDLRAVINELRSYQESLSPESTDVKLRIFLSGDYTHAHFSIVYKRPMTAAEIDEEKKEEAQRKRRALLAEKTKESRERQLMKALIEKYGVPE